MNLEIKDNKTQKDSFLPITTHRFLFICKSTKRGTKMFEELITKFR